MQKFIVLLLFGFLFACGASKDDKEILDSQGTNVPQYYDDDNDGIVEYNPIDSSVQDELQTFTEECFVREGVTTTRIRITETIWSGIKVFKSGTYEAKFEDLSNKGYNLDYLENANHLHLKKVSIDIEPGTLNIVEFVILKTEDNTPLAWFRGDTVHSLEANVNGEIDLMEYIDDEGIVGNYMAKAMAPKDDTNIMIKAYFDVYYGCDG